MMFFFVLRVLASMEYWEKYVEFDESSICYKVMGDQTGWLWVVKHREMEKNEWNSIYMGPMEGIACLFDLASVYSYVITFFVLSTIKVWFPTYITRVSTSIGEFLMVDRMKRSSSVPWYDEILGQNWSFQRFGLEVGIYK